MTNPEIVSQWSRRFVLTGAIFLVCWNGALVLGVGRRTSVILGLFGFVFHTIFGKAYSLVPTYFDRTLHTDRLLLPHFVLTASGTAMLAGGTAFAQPSVITIGAILWMGGIALFLGTLVATLQGNLTGSETSTGAHNEHRETVDRVANAGTPAALLFLGIGSLGFMLSELVTSGSVVSYTPRWIHLLAVGSATLLIFSLGFRLLPRFLSTTPPSGLVWVVIPAGMLGPLLLALGLPDGSLLQVGALFQSIAVAGYALLVVTLLVRTERYRVGYGAILAGALSGLLVISLGLLFAFEGQIGQHVMAHLRVALLGFLGLTIVGVSYQFYPPAVFDGAVTGNRFLGKNPPITGERLARLVTLLLCSAVIIELIQLAGTGGYVIYSSLLATVGAFLHCGLLYGMFRNR